MYDPGDALPVDSLPSGSVLVSGPPMTGKYELLLRFIVAGVRYGDGGLFVTTNESARSIHADIEVMAGEVSASLRMVDCVSEQQSIEGRLPKDRVEYVNSPGDMTGVGIGISEQLRRFAEEETERTRVVFDSLSTLLMYSDAETVFRFLHVLTGRIDGVDAVGLFTIDPTTHDRETVNTLKQLFDGAIEIRDGEAGREVRFAGLPDTPEGWISLG
jgi:KaiC/GvpD/RAD55 family RecA-like ATPase